MLLMNSNPNNFLFYFYLFNIYPNIRIKEKMNETSIPTPYYIPSNVMTPYLVFLAELDLVEWPTGYSHLIFVVFYSNVCQCSGLICNDVGL